VFSKFYFECLLSFNRLVQIICASRTSHARERHGKPVRRELLGEGWSEAQLSVRESYCWVWT